MSEENNALKNWRELCEAAAKEHDPEKLRELVRQINDALAPRIRSRVTEYEYYGDTLSPHDEDREARPVCLADRYTPEKSWAEFAEICILKLPRLPRAYSRFFTWKARTKVKSSLMCVPLRSNPLS
jgi:hypothetical protein